MIGGGYNEKYIYDNYCKVKLKKQRIKSRRYE